MKISKNETDCNLLTISKPDYDLPEARCHCGHLVARLRETGVELKCKRCKQIALIPFEHMAEFQDPKWAD